MTVGEEGQNEFMNQILLANNLLPQPVFQVCEELVIHESGLCYRSVRNSVISDHYNAETFKNFPRGGESRAGQSETRQFIACQGVCEPLLPVFSAFTPAFKPLNSRESCQKGAIFFGAACEAELIAFFKGALESVAFESFHHLSLVGASAPGRRSDGATPLSVGHCDGWLMQPERMPRCLAQRGYGKRRGDIYE